MNDDKVNDMRRRLVMFWAVLLAVSALLVVVTAALAGEGGRFRLASVSGMPHVDVGDYDAQPFWRPGMPRGANSHWDAFMSTTVAQVTRDADAVAYTGDEVQGRWYGYRPGDPKVFGPDGTDWRDRRIIQRAGDSMYGYLTPFWPADTMFALGDHEIGDIWRTIPPGDLRYDAHWHWRDVWKRHHGGETLYQRDLGPVTVVTLDPFVRWRRGIFARVATSRLLKAKTWVDAAHAEGDWVVVQSEIPAVGPNREDGTSGLILRNGASVIDALSNADLFLAAEFHAVTVRETDGPVQVVHGGTYEHVEWATFDFGRDDVEITSWEAVPTYDSPKTIWSMDGTRANRRPVAGAPKRTGTATLTRDGSWSGSGELGAF